MISAQELSGFYAETGSRATELRSLLGHFSEERIRLLPDPEKRG
jgi:hypothetical protein